jgi:hypothetical protein
MATNGMPPPAERVARVAGSGVLALPEVDEGGDDCDEEDGRDQVLGHGAYPFVAPRRAFTRALYAIAVHSSPVIIGLFAGAAAFLGAWYFSALHAAEPVLPLRLFRNSVFSVSAASRLTFRPASARSRMLSSPAAYESSSKRSLVL